MKMNRFVYPLLLLLCCFSIPSFSAELPTPTTIGIINFETCVTESKYGKQEQEAYEQIKNQMMTLMSDIEKQVKDLMEKRNNPEVMDALSPEADQEMQSRIQSLTEEYYRYRNQAEQVMGQAQRKMYQTLATQVSKGSETVAKQKKLSIILNKEAVFYYLPKDDVTKPVIDEMDKDFAKEKELKK